MAGRRFALFIALLFVIMSALVPGLWTTQSMAAITGDQPPASGDWVVDENTTVTNEDILLNGDLIVKGGAVLVLRDSILRLNSTTEGEFGITVEEEATLRAFNVTFTRGDSANYTFAYEFGSHGHIEDSRIEHVEGPGLNRGIAIQATNVTLHNNHIRNSLFGVQLSQPATLTQNTIYNTTHGVIMIGTLGANNISADNSFDLAANGNVETNVRYYLERDLRVVNQTGHGHRGATVYLNDSKDNNWIDGDQTDNDGWIADQWLIVWQELADETNQSLEPYQMTAIKNDVERNTYYNFSDGNQITVQIDLWPDLMIDSAELQWGSALPLVASGRDNETIHRWISQGRDENDPNGWMDIHFDEEYWNEAPAPFGDTGAYNTYWATNSQEAFFRHNFSMPEGIRIIEAYLNIASNDHGAHYFNGELIFSDIDQNDHGQWYWNSQTEIDPAFFRLGKTNVLASKVQVGAGGGGGNRQFYDAEISVKYVFDEPTAMVNRYPAVVTIPVSNLGDADADDLQLRLYDDGEIQDTFTLDLGAGEEAEVVFDWTPEGKGNHTLRVLADDPDQYTESDENNNEAQAEVFIGFYGFNVSVNGTDGLSIPFNTTANFILNIENIGDLNDTYTFETSGVPTDWDLDITPSKIYLIAGESGQVEASVVPKRGASQDNYTMTITPHSSYEIKGELPTAVPAGRYNGTVYNYMITTNSGDIPSDWYETDYDDSNWSQGDAPFGDREMGGINPGTDWDESSESWCIIRHWFKIPDEYKAKLSLGHLEMAFNNYAEPYINGHKIFNEAGGTWHGAEYWNDDGDADISLDWLNVDGPNLLAIKARDGGGGGSNSQWIDAEFTLKLAEGSSQAAIEVEILPTYDFVVSEDEVFDWHDVGTEETYDISFYNFGNEQETVDFTMEITDQIGGWMVNLSDTNETLNADRGGQVRLEVYGYADLWVDEYINITVTVSPRNAFWQEDVFYLNLTALLPPDNDPPDVRVRSTPERWVRTENVTLEWYILTDTNDTSFYHVYYQNVTEWGSGIESDWFFAGKYPVQQDNDTFSLEHGQEYRFFAIGEDARGNLQKYKAPLYDIWFRVDLVPPETLLTVKELETETIGSVNVSEVELNWNRLDLEVEDDIDYFSIEYRRQPLEGNWSAWMLAPGLENTNFKTGDFPMEDGYVYQFRSIAYDEAGWRENKSTFDAQVTVDRTPPGSELTALPHFTIVDEVELSLQYSDKADVFKLHLEYSLFNEGSPNNEYTWYPIATFQQGNLVDQPSYGPLSNGKRYLFRSLAEDTIGNVEPRDGILENFTGDGSLGQTYQLKHLPTPSSHPEFSSINIDVDTDQDGRADLSLIEATKLQSPSHFTVDYETGIITFGDSSKGYKPADGFDIIITYDGYDAWTVVDLQAPVPPGQFQEPEIDLANGSVDLRWETSISKDVVSYQLEMASLKAGPYTLVEELQAPTQGKYLSTTVTNLVEDEKYFFRVLAKDEAGLFSDPNEPVLKVEMKEEKPNGGGGGGDDGLGILPILAVLAILILAAAGGYYLYTQNLGEGEEATAAVLTTVSEEELATMEGATAVEADPDSPFEHAEGDSGELSCGACGTLFTPVPGVSEVTCPGCGQTGGLPPEEAAAEAVAVEAAPVEDTPTEDTTAEATPAEEAPAEDTPAEEATIEDPTPEAPEDAKV